MTLTARRASVAAALVALASFWLLHRKGIGLSGDGWSYWEGAASLAAGRGYTHFSGGRIVEWPPLYSAYLAAWAVAFGPTGRGLLVANGALVTAQAWLWCWTLLTIWRDARRIPSPVVVCAVAVYLGVMIPVAEQAVLADVLKYTLLPLLLLTTWRIRQAGDAAALTRWLVLNGSVGTLLLLVHNDSIAFVAASWLMTVSRGASAGRRMAIAAAGALPVIVWALIRHALGQDRSHALQLGSGRYSAGAYLWQVARGAGAVIGPDRDGVPFMILIVCLVLFGIMARRRDGGEIVIFGGAFAACAAAVTYALFNVTWIDDSLAGRFLLFLPLIVVPMMLLASGASSRALFACCAVMFIAPPIYWTVSWLRLRTTASVEQLGYPTGFVTPIVRLSPDYPAGPPVPSGDEVVVAPRGWTRVE